MPSSGRTAGRRDFCERLKAEGAGEAIQVRTGLLIDAYFSGSKIRWLLDHVPGARARAEAASWRSGPSTRGWCGS
jgi:glycerol kinase